MKDEIRAHGGRPMDEAGPDPLLGQALRALDPGRDDPGYWLRFQQGVMAAARDELVRRRMLADVTIGELVTSWSRTLVPAAVLAAAVASFLLLQPVPGGAPATGTLALEEMIFDELGAEFLQPVGEPVMDVTFASEAF